jgi:uncharacterized protein (DUF2236 family)
VSWKINREIVMLLGWPAAILMQLAHPLVLAGVLDHSVAVADPGRRLERLRSTIESMLELSFGTERDMLRAAGRINAIHDRVHGQLRQPASHFPAGTPYSAHDPELLRWVHATLMDVIPRTYELLIGPLTQQEKDDYCAEATIMGPLLGMPDGFLPASSRELEAYMRQTYASGAIEVLEPARRLAGELLAPPYPLPRWRIFAWPNAQLTPGLLPPHLRQAYHFSWTTADRAWFAATARMMRYALRHIPPMMRHWPASRRGSDGEGRREG